MNTTQEQAQHILHLTKIIPAIVAKIGEAEFNAKPGTNKWSKKEILGHLIDSAANNHQRIVRAQYEDATIAYNQEKWNSINHYDAMPTEDIVNFWVAYNRHLAGLINSMLPENLLLACNMADGKVATLEWLIGDYIDHMEHHLRQITGDSLTNATDRPTTRNNRIHYIQAAEQDAGTLAAYRIEFLTELTGKQTNEQINELRQHLEDYFRSAINNKEYIGMLAKEGDKVVGTGGMTIRIQPGSFKNPSGKMGYILNMYTIPAYRKQGICGTLLKMLLATGKERGMGGFELHATKDGEPVYRKYGFELHHEPTLRKFGFSVPEE